MRTDRWTFWNYLLLFCELIYFHLTFRFSYSEWSHFDVGFWRERVSHIMYGRQKKKLYRKKINYNTRFYSKWFIWLQIAVQNVIINFHLIKLKTDWSRAMPSFRMSLIRVFKMIANGCKLVSRIYRPDSNKVCVAFFEVWIVWSRDPMNPDCSVHHKSTVWSVWRIGVFVQKNSTGYPRVTYDNVDKIRKSFQRGPCMPTNSASQLL